jgi:dTDP-glucose 4,6-dehydratase
MIFVTGGAGFIGSNFVLNWLKNNNEPVLVIDSLTYAGNLENLKSVEDNLLFAFHKLDINNQDDINVLLAAKRPRSVVHFAAESHVDRSILGPDAFIQTNINGTFRLLGSCLSYFQSLSPTEQHSFRFLHVSTDEVYGSLEAGDPAFCEATPYAPNSPYSASKAASDHLVRAWHHTYGLPVLTTNCSNNYGPYQFPEKLIPLTIANALEGKPLPIYGNGLNIRDWLYVVDHCEGIAAVLQSGSPGQVYNIGGWNEMTNIDIVRSICQLLDEKSPGTAKAAGGRHEDLIRFVKDRPGHDKRYAINANKIFKELGWKPQETFESGINKTIDWYLNNTDWVRRVQSGDYKNWIHQQYSNRAA